MSWLAAIAFCACWLASHGHNLHCKEPAGTASADLSKDLLLPSDYSITVRFTDWMTNKTSKFVERNFTDSVMLSRTNRQGERTWIKSPERLLVIEGDDCSKANATELRLAYNISEQLRKYLGGDAHLFANILQSAVELKYNSTNLQGVHITNGVESLGWVGCVHNLTADGTTHLEVDATYAAPLAGQKPYSKDFKSPVVFTINIVLYQDSNDTDNGNATILEHVSFDVVTLEKTDATERQSALMQPRGVFCANMEKAKPPAHFPERFEADVEFVNMEKKSVDTIELMFDESQRIVSFAFDADNDADVPFLANASVLLPKQKRVKVVHDFNFGLQYILSKDGRECYEVSAIKAGWADTNSTNGLIYMRTPSEMVMDAASDDAYYAGKVAIHGHQEFDMYVSKKSAPDGECVVELLFNSEDWTVEGIKQQSLHSIVQYHKDKSGKLLRKTVTSINSLHNNTQLGSSWTRHNVYPCLTDSLSENFFFVTIEGENMKSLKQIGVENVESSLVEAISQVANISVLRISQFLLKEDKKDVHACFIVGEADNATAKTAYLREQKSVKEVHDILNSTLLKNSLKLKVVKDNLETKTLSVNGFGTISPSTEPQPQPSFDGYSGGSMFVLGMFSFIFGALIAVGTYVFYHKRQAIRGMAYQVFE